MILCTNTLKRLFMLIFMGSCWQTKSINWYKEDITKYDDNAAKNNVFVLVSNMKKSINVVHISDKGKSNNDRWVTQISTIVHKKAPKKRAVMVMNFVRGFILKILMHIGMKVNRKIRLIK